MKETKLDELVKMQRTVVIKNSDDCTMCNEVRLAQRGSLAF